jgi:hypothetical protein
MEKSEGTPKTLGQAIDIIIQALSGLDDVRWTPIVGQFSA